MSAESEPWSSSARFDVRIEATNSHRRAIVTVGGEIDLQSAPQFRSALGDAGGRCDAVVVDLGAVGFMDSSGVHALLDVWKAVLANGGSLVVARTSSPVARVLDLLGLSELLAESAEA